MLGTVVVVVMLILLHLEKGSKLYCTPQRGGRASRFEYRSFSYCFKPAAIFASSALTFPTRRLCLSSFVNFSSRKAFTRSSASVTPITREPTTSTLLPSCSTP